MTPYDCATLCLGIYGREPVDWDWRTPDGSTVVVGAKKGDDGVTSIVFQGTRDPLGWMLDFLAIPIHPTISHASLGPLHAGFYVGMEDALAAILRRTREPRHVMGHSLGAAHAQDMAGLLVATGQPPVRLTLFAPPRAGQEPLRKLLAPVPIDAYWNGGKMVWDPVPGVPLWVPPFAEYVHVRGLTDIHVPPKEPLNPAAWHDCELYRQGVRQ